MQSSTFYFHAPPTPQLYTLSLHDALPIWDRRGPRPQTGLPDRWQVGERGRGVHRSGRHAAVTAEHSKAHPRAPRRPPGLLDRKSTRLNSSHSQISYAVFCLKKKKKQTTTP